MITVNWITGVISVPKADLTLVQSSPYEVYELDMNDLHLVLRDLEDDEEGRPYPITHDFTDTKVVAGVTKAAEMIIRPPYTITFENGAYVASIVGGDTNIIDVVNLNTVSVRQLNSVGQIVTNIGSGLSTQEALMLKKVWQALMLDPANPVRNQRFDANNSRITFDDVAIDLVGPEDSDVLGTRQP